MESLILFALFMIVVMLAPHKEVEKMVRIALVAGVVAAFYFGLPFIFAVAYAVAIHLQG